MYVLKSAGEQFLWGQKWWIEKSILRRPKNQIRPLLFNPPLLIGSFLKNKLSFICQSINAWTLLCCAPNQALIIVHWFVGYHELLYTHLYLSFEGNLSTTTMIIDIRVKVVNCGKSILLELKKLGGLIIPSVIVNLLESSILLTSSLFISYLGKGNLASFSIATSYYNIFWIFLEGILSAQDMFCSQAFGTHDMSELRSWIFVSILVTMITCVFGTIFFCFSYFFFLDGFKIPSHLAWKSAVYVYLLIPSLWLSAGFRIFQKYLFAQKQVLPVVLCTLLGSLINALGN